MSTTRKIDLPARLGLAEVRPLLSELRKTVDEDVNLDARKVTHIGTLCLQVLIAAARDHKFTETKFVLTDVGDAVVRQLAHFGLSPELVQGGLE